jgi:serine/threonine protein kinase
LSQSDKLGKYEVIRQIAVGGMAELYLARTVGMEGFEKLVCVKRILPQYINNPSFVNMFLNEARLAATLHHPNIAQVYEIGQEQGEFFFAMEYVHGEDLGRLVATAQETGVAISLDCALTLASGLCAGLHHAHEKASPEGKPLGVVHRDVSPTNVLVSYDGAVKLVDFGIARAGGTSPSTTGLKGKISYMSPEQCRGRAALDRRSDVFSIGTILYELTTGRRPFVDETEYGVLQQIVTHDADPPSTVTPGYPPALEAIVMRALSRDVDRRFATALELQNQVEDFAHENRLRVSPLVLARLMSTLFPARLEEWDHARAQGAFFVEQHVVRTLIESGKTADGGARTQPAPATDEEATTQAEAPTIPSPHGGEHEAPTVPAGPRTAESEAPTVPAGRSSAPTIAMQSAGGGEPPRLPAPPPVGSLATPMPVATPVSQPGLPTPPPVPGVAPLPGVRYAQMPVPNNPGAVPILTPMMAPPIASAGTLVSSALQAGTSAAASTMTPGSAMAPPPAMPYPPPGNFGAGDPASYGYGQLGRSSGGHTALPLQQPPQGEPAGGRSSARPTLVMRAKRRSWLPLVAVASAGLAGLITLLLLNFGEEAPPARSGAPAENTAKTAMPGAPDPAKSAEPSAAKPPRSGAGADPALAGAAPAGTPAAGAANAAADPTGGAAANAARAGAANAAALGAADSAVAGNSASPATGAANAAAPGAAAANSAVAGADASAATNTAAITAPGAAPSALLPSEASPPSDAKKRTVKAPPETRKPARPRPRPDAKRGDARRKPEAKEPSWNDDSPFMPVQTQKR